MYVRVIWTIEEHVGVKIKFKSIGIVRSPYKSKEDVLNIKQDGYVLDVGQNIDVLKVVIGLMLK